MPFYLLVTMQRMGVLRPLPSPVAGISLEGRLVSRPLRRRHEHLGLLASVCLVGEATGEASGVCSYRRMLTARPSKSESLEDRPTEWAFMNTKLPALPEKTEGMTSAPKPSPSVAAGGASPAVS